MKKMAFILAFVFSLLLFTPALAQDPTSIPDDLVNKVARDLYCPVCENIPLDVCPTQACAQWRELIREKLALGWDKKQIEIYFSEQYGEKVLAVPPASGLNWLIYILPPVFIISGLVLVSLLLRKPKVIPSVENTTITLEDEVSASLIKKIEQDLDGGEK